MATDQPWDGDAYQRRIDDLARTGKEMHGEADFVCRYEPGTVLDAGCGTGRVAIELGLRGVDVVGVDVDASMLATARQRAGDIEWVEADLRDLDLGRRFDVVVLAGNVPLFTPPGTQRQLIAGVAAHVAPGGRLVAGFSTDWADRPYDAGSHERWCRDAGLVEEERYSTWDREPWSATSTYAVSVAVRR